MTKVFVLEYFFVEVLLIFGAEFNPDVLVVGGSLFDKFEL